MDVEAKQDASCSIKKTLRCFIRVGWRCASEHRAVFSLALLLYLLYRSSPGFFAFLLSSSPVIICTTILLGVLLSYGIKDLPEVDVGEKAPSDSAAKLGSYSRNVHIEAYERFSVPAVKENIIREASLGRRNSNKHFDLDENVPLLKGGCQRDERVDDAGGRLEKMLDHVPSTETLEQEISMEVYMKADAEKESKDAVLGTHKKDEYANLVGDVHQNETDGKDTTVSLSQGGESEDVSEHKAADGEAGKRRWGRAFSVRQRFSKLADTKVEAVNSTVDNQLDYSLYSQFTRAISHDCSSGFDSDNAEQDSTDVSMANTGTMPDATETEPLLGADFSCPVPTNNDNSDNHSNVSSQDSESDSDSNDVADNSKAKQDGEEKKAPGNEPAFLWTADDEKNAMDLGYSEIERNRRLEILMAKRKSRKHMSFEFDGSDVSSFRPQALAISARRPNPFADDAEVPGSAPSVLHSRKNPFDFLAEQSDNSGVLARDNLNPQEFSAVSVMNETRPMTVSQQDTLFKRHESFNLGGPQRHVSRFKPCFVLEEFKFDETSTSNFQRQFSDRSVSRLSVVSECDTVSLVGDQEHNELIRNYIRGVRESPSLLRQDSDHVYAGNECSDGIIFGDNDTLNAMIC